MTRSCLAKGRAPLFRNGNAIIPLFMSEPEIRPGLRRGCVKRDVRRTSWQLVLQVSPGRLQPVTIAPADAARATRFGGALVQQPRRPVRPGVPPPFASRP